MLRWNHSLWKRNCEIRWSMRKQGLTWPWVYGPDILRPCRVVSSSSELLAPMLWGLWCFFYGLAQNLNFSSLYSLSASTTARLGAMSQPDLSLMLVVVWDLMTAGTQKYLFSSFSMQQLLPSFFLLLNFTCPTAFFSLLLPLSSCFLLSVSLFSSSSGPHHSSLLC